MFRNSQYVIPAKPVLSAAKGAGIQIPVWTLRQWQIMPSAKICYDWYYTRFLAGGQEKLGELVAMNR
jgi:hypothetical protein